LIGKTVINNIKKEHINLLSYKIRLSYDCACVRAYVYKITIV